MVRLQTFEEWQRQSSLLLQARPNTARITTKYNVPNLSNPKYNRPSKKPSSTDAQATDTKPADRVPRATIILKTHDTASGVVLKFKTDRAADVSRLFVGLGSLGRHMAALPEKVEVKDVDMTSGEVTTDSALTGSKVQSQPQQQQQQQQQGQTSGGGGGGKKKKKGKR